MQGPAQIPGSCRPRPRGSVVDDAKRDRALHRLMREVESRQSGMRTALERLCARALPAPVSPDDVLKALGDILYGRGVPGIRRSHVGAAEGLRARKLRRVEGRDHAHRAKSPEDQLMPDGTVKALVWDMLDHLAAVGVPTGMQGDRETCQATPRFTR